MVGDECEHHAGYRHGRQGGARAELIAHVYINLKGRDGEDDAFCEREGERGGARWGMGVCSAFKPGHSDYPIFFESGNSSNKNGYMILVLKKHYPQFRSGTR
jgi:hypothetical protein